MHKEKKSRVGRQLSPHLAIFRSSCRTVFQGTLTGEFLIVYPGPFGRFHRFHRLKSTHRYCQYRHRAKL